LPYDIGVRDGRNALPQTLFHEAELYEDLQPRTIAIVIEENDPAQYVVLERSWPGELDASGRRLFHPWLRFPFPHGIQGPVTISYEAGRGFVAQDGATTINKPEFVGDPDVYLAPPERGTM